MTTSNWQLFALSSAFFAGLTAILGKVGVVGINSNLATLIRTGVIFIVTAILVSLQGEWKKPEQLSAHSLLFLILSGISTGLSWLCYYRALQLGPASRVAPVDKLSMVFVIFLALVFLGEKLSLKLILGGAFILTGSIILALP